MNTVKEIGRDKVVWSRRVANKLLDLGYCMKRVDVSDRGYGKVVFVFADEKETLLNAIRAFKSEGMR